MRAVSQAEQDPQHLEILKFQIDTSAGRIDFAKGPKTITGFPSVDVYRAATRYAHVRYLECCDSLHQLYDDIRRSRRQALFSKAKAEGTTLRMVELSWITRGLERRALEIPELRIGDETWIQGAPKGLLQVEIVAAVEARQKVEEERERMMPLKEEATEAWRGDR